MRLGPNVGYGGLGLTAEEHLAAVREAESLGGLAGVARRRFLLIAFGDPGHAFPAIALGRALAARGHDVCLQTWRRWEAHVEREGMRFAAAPEYRVWPTPDHPLEPYAAAVRAARETRPLIREVDPDVVVVDILTVAGALAAELEERAWATLVPHVLPVSAPGFPLYSTGARLPRTRAGAALWRALDPLVAAGLRRGRADLNEARRRVGLPPVGHLHGGISRRLALVGTFPQLEYPRAEWDPAVRVVGPLLWEPPSPEVPLPPADAPLVLVAPSTSQDPGQSMLRAALEGLRGEPVRVLAATNRTPPPPGTPLPANATVVDWLSYRRVMPRCAAVICHGGHGTVAHALAAGAPLVVTPGGGDMAENGARVAWARAGVSLPRRLTSPRGIRLAVRRVLADDGYARRTHELAGWAQAHSGPARAAEELERLAGDTPQPAATPAQPRPGEVSGDATATLRTRKPRDPG